MIGYRRLESLNTARILEAHHRVEHHRLSCWMQSTHAWFSQQGQTVEHKMLYDTTLMKSEGEKRGLFTAKQSVISFILAQSWGQPARIEGLVRGERNSVGNSC
jgi:hypothetical protein